MATKTTQEIVNEKLSDADRFVDMRLDVVEVDDNKKRTGRKLLSAGGTWDRRKGKYVNNKKQTARVMQAHPGQVEFVDWFNCWLDDHVAGVVVPDEDAIYSALLAGGQRAGKTQVGVAVVAVSYALARPGSIVWVVAPTDKDFEEIEDYLEDCMPRGWYKKLGAPWWRYTLVNGSKIVLRSAFHPEALKKGRADLIIANECQQMKQAAFGIMRARIADNGGIVVGLANPPNTPGGAWVGDWAIEAQSGMRQSRYFYFDPFLNPFINRNALRAMSAEMDDREFDEQVMGKFLAAKGMSIHNWNRFANEKKPPPKSKSIMQKFCQHFEGREFDHVFSVDVQKHPYMASAEWDFFENPLARKGDARFEWCHMWAIGEILLEGADEFDLADAWLEMGVDPKRTLVICDASGQWQMAERSDSAKLGEIRKKIGGRGSFDAFRSRGFDYVVTPDRNSRKNPDIIERVRATTARVSTKSPGPYGQSFIFSDPKLKKLNRCVRRWPTKHGKPSRTSEFAHAGDAFTYGPYRFFPRDSRKKLKANVEVIKRIDSKRMKGW